MPTSDDVGKAKWRAEIAKAIESAYAEGYRTLAEIIPHVGGADPSIVREIVQSMPVPAAPGDVSTLDSRARKSAAEFRDLLPAADPMSSQWWFTLATIEEMAKKARRASSGNSVAFLGTPTVANYFAERYANATCFDHDRDVVETLNRVHPGVARQWDARNGSPAVGGVKFAAAVLDPPWYPDFTRAFLSVALTIVAPEGQIFCSMPSKNTRPGVIEERNALIDELQSLGLEIISIDAGRLHYDVPHFEARAFRSVDGFTGRPWRTGDLMVIRTGPSEVKLIPSDIPEQSRTTRFAREPSTFRVFVDETRGHSQQKKWIARVPEFENKISTRGFDKSAISIWTTEKVGASLSDVVPARIALEAWSRSESPKQAAESIKLQGYSTELAEEVVRALVDEIGLWRDVQLGGRQTKDQIAERMRGGPLAAVASARSHATPSDGFRLEFQRDRDRVLWSSGLRRLSNKTQVFSFDEDDNVRQRLGHSVEVMQLATTIGASFGLDLNLIEAGALAHDIGHTPFGHAGEHAIHRMLDQLAPSAGGFNHYEHGVDVVRWLEDVYRSPSSEGRPGLDLTPEVSECIFKHTYCREGKALSQTELFKTTKHNDLFQDNACHLEGQCVRAADKISYLISDLEDGIRLGVFKWRDLESCRLFQRPPIDMEPKHGETLLERFLSQRGAIIKVLMEDVILETERRLSRLTARSEIFLQKDYSVCHSEEIIQDTSEIWEKLQKGILHKHPLVRRSNLRAATIVSELFLLFAAVPSLIDEVVFRSHRGIWATSYMQHYRERCTDKIAIPKALLSPLHLERLIDGPHFESGAVQVSVEELVLAKDYVASLTDSGARRLYAQLLGAP